MLLPDWANSAFMPTIAGGAKSILFGDLGYYWVADREGRLVGALNHHDLMLAKVI